MQTKFDQLSKEFSDKREQPTKGDARKEIINFLKDKFGYSTATLSKMDT